MQKSLSLVFVIDATGSMHMGDIFKALKETIRSIVSDLNRSMVDFTFELACVAYRDVGDVSPPRFQVSKFSGSISKLESFLSEIVAVGGGDCAEDVVGGLAQADELFSEGQHFVNKVVCLCADAPCHGAAYHDGVHDYYADSSFPGQKDSATVLRALKEKGVALNFFRVNASTDKMIAKFNEEAGGEFIETCELDVTDMSTIASSITKSISKTISRSFTGSASAASSGVKLASRSKASMAMKHVGKKLSKMTTIPAASDEGHSDSTSGDGGGSSADAPPALPAASGGGSGYCANVECGVAKASAGAKFCVECGHKH